MPRLLKSLLTALALAVFQPASGDQSGPESAPAQIQSQFGIAMDRLQSGEVAAATEILANLASETDSPRIRLEWARALFLAQRYDESREVFEMVLETPGLPWQVEENIHTYLDRIDRAAGSVDLSLAIITETNPKNFTSVKQVELLGMTLNVVPPDDNEPLTGIEYGLDAYAPLLANRRLSGHVNASFTDYPRSEFDELNGRAELILDLRGNDRLLLKAGSGIGYQDGRRFYRQPFVGARVNFPLQRDRLALEMQASRIFFDSMPSFDGPRQSASLSWTRYLSGNRGLTLNLGLQRAITRHPADSSRTLSVSGRYTLPGGWRQSRIEPSIQLSRKRHDDTNPYFGGLREDDSATIGIDWVAKGFRLFGLTPRIGVSWTKNESTLPYYSYHKSNLVLRLE